MNQWWMDSDCLVIGRPSQERPKKKRRNHAGRMRGSPVAAARVFLALNFAVGFVFGDKTMVGWSFGHVLFPF